MQTTQNVKTVSGIHTHTFPIIQADAFVMGDGKAVKDKETGLIWLDFGINRAVSFNDVLKQLNTIYKGWRLPTESEVRHLWSRLFSDAATHNPYEVFHLWGANKTPLDHLPYLSWGYFLDDRGFLAHASFVETGTQVASFNPDKYYIDGSLKHEIVTDEGAKYDGSDKPPFNMSGTEEQSTLLVKMESSPKLPHPH